MIVSGDFASQIGDWIGKNYSALFEPSATLAATFIGAWLAFRYQQIVDRKKEVDARVDAANRLIFQLMDNANWMKYLQQDFIDPIRENPGRMLLLRPVFLPPPQVNIDVESVSFLISINKVGLLSDISIQRKSFLQVAHLLQERSKLYVERVNPSLEKGGVRHGSEVTDVQVRAALGEDVFFMLNDMTEGLIKHVDATLHDHVRVGAELWSAMKKAYPKHNFIKFSFDPR